MVKPYNGGKPRIITPNIGKFAEPMPPGGDECVTLLEEMLESAKNGDMTWLIVVAGGPADYGTAMAGSNAAQMNLGLDVAKHSILERVKVR
jgi:hypothetical protein